MGLIVLNPDGCRSQAAGIRLQELKIGSILTTSNIFSLCAQRAEELPSAENHHLHFALILFN